MRVRRVERGRPRRPPEPEGVAFALAHAQELLRHLDGVSWSASDAAPDRGVAVHYRVDLSDVDLSAYAGPWRHSCFIECRAAPLCATLDVPHALFWSGSLEVCSRADQMSLDGAILIGAHLASPCARRLGPWLILHGCSTTSSVDATLARRVEPVGGSLVEGGCVLHREVRRAMDTGLLLRADLSLDAGLGVVRALLPDYSTLRDPVDLPRGVRETHRSLSWWSGGRFFHAGRLEGDGVRITCGSALLLLAGERFEGDPFRYLHPFSLPWERA